MRTICRTIWVCCCLLAFGIANANEISVSDLVSVPESIEIDGLVLTGSAYLYFNAFPGGPELPNDCRRHGRFIVIVTLYVKDLNLRNGLSATRIWVAQREKTWSGRILEADRRREEADRIEFVSRDCNAPIVPTRYPPVSDQSDPDNAIRAKTIIELNYAGKRYLLRLPDAGVGVAS